MPRENRFTLAVLLMLLSSLSFALMGVTVKAASELPIFMKVFFRNFVMVLILLLTHSRRRGPRGTPRPRILGTGSHRRHLFLRSILGLAGVILYFYSVDHLALADSSLLNRLSPFFVTLFACLFLGERLTVSHLSALLLAFFGAVLIIKPRMDLSLVPAAAGFLSAATAGAAYTIVSYLGGRETPVTVMFWFSGLSTLITLPLALLAWQSPSPGEWVALILTGVLAAGGQYALTEAYQYAPAGKVSLYNYTHILFSGILGWVFFRETPDRLSVLGGIIILGAALFLFLKQKGVSSDNH